MIYIEPIKVKWEPGRFLLEGHTRQERAKFEDYCAQAYVEQIRHRVEDEIMKARWTPLSAAYLRRKQERGWSLKIWKATGQLMKELKVKSRRVVGFDNRKRHRESGSPLTLIARANEYGTLSIPARPLFRPTYWYMRRHVSDFYQDFLESER